MCNKKFIFQSILFFICGILFTSMLVANNSRQQKDTLIGDEVILLDSIPDNFDYLNIPLEGVIWKLVGYGTKDAKLIYPLKYPLLGTECTILFSNNELTGRSFTNKIYGEYEIDISLKTINIMNLVSTRVGEEKEGQEYFNNVGNINRYEFTPKGLFLYYEPNLFLFFRIFQE